VLQAPNDYREPVLTCVPLTEPATETVKSVHFEFCEQRFEVDHMECAAVLRESSVFREFEWD